LSRLKEWWNQSIERIQLDGVALAEMVTALRNRVHKAGVI
jgi:hypothetical protein